MTSNKKPEIKLTALSNYLSPKVCHEMIAVCAYYKAEKRGFVPGYELKDWNEAEQEINKQNFYKFQT
jgi:hypothetical protein